MARIMPPRRFKKKSVKRIVEKRVAKAIEEYEKTRVDSNNTGGSGSANTGGTVSPDVQGCSYKTFMNGKPHSFSGTEGVVGLKRWFEKMEQTVTLHDAINMARELIEQGVQAKALMIGDSNKRMWEDQQRETISQQQNQGQEVQGLCAAPAKVEAPLESYHGAIGARNLISQVEFLLGVVMSQLGHPEGECSTRFPGSKRQFTTECDMLWLGNHGHYRSDCPELKNETRKKPSLVTGSTWNVHTLVGGETNQNFTHHGG
ncbi:hypothetical protein Tco_0949810 [Tanacetum coccineum]